MISLQEVESLVKDINAVIKLTPEVFEKQMESRKETGYFSFVDIPVKVDLEEKNIFSVCDKNMDMVVMVSDRFRNASLSQISRKVFLFYRCLDKNLMYAIRPSDLKDDVLDKFENMILMNVPVSLDSNKVINGEVDRIPHAIFKSIDLTHDPKFKKLKTKQGVVYKVDDFYISNKCDPETDDVLQLVDVGLEVGLLKVMNVRFEDRHLECLAETYKKVDNTNMKASIIKMCVKR